MIVVRRNDLEDFLDSCMLVGKYEVTIENVNVSQYASRSLEFECIEDEPTDKLVRWAMMFDERDAGYEPEILFGALDPILDPTIDNITLVEVCYLAANNDVLARPDVYDLINDWKKYKSFEGAVRVSDIPEVIKWVKESNI